MYKLFSLSVYIAHMLLSRLQKLAREARHCQRKRKNNNAVQIGVPPRKMYHAFSLTANLYLREIKNKNVTLGEPVPARTLVIPSQRSLRPRKNSCSFLRDIIYVLTHRQVNYANIPYYDTEIVLPVALGKLQKSPSQNLAAPNTLRGCHLLPMRCIRKSCYIGIRATQVAWDSSDIFEKSQRNCSLKN